MIHFYFCFLSNWDLLLSNFKLIIVFYTLFLIPILHTFYFNFLFIILSSMTFPPIHGLFYLFSHVKTLFFEIWICITLIIKYHFIYLTILLYTEWDPNLSTLTSIGFLLCNLSIGPFFFTALNYFPFPIFLWLYSRFPSWLDGDKLDGRIDQSSCFPVVFLSCRYYIFLLLVK